MKNNSSANTRRAADEDGAMKDKAKLSQEANDRFEAEREADPEWTAVITYRDNTTLRKRWIRTDALNDSIF
jgi:hypothetical protein